MGEKALWPTVTVVGLICAMLTAMVLKGVDPVTLLAILGILFTGIGSVVSVLLYGKALQIEKNTNGTAAADKALIMDLISTLKKSPPVED